MKMNMMNMTRPFSLHGYLARYEKVEKLPRIFVASVVVLK